MAAAPPTVYLVPARPHRLSSLWLPVAVFVAALVLVLLFVDNKWQAAAAALILTTLGIGLDEVKLRYSLKRVTQPPQGEIVIGPPRPNGFFEDLVYVGFIVVNALIDLEFAVLFFGIPIGHALGRVWEARRVTRLEREKSWRLFRPKYARTMWRNEYFALTET